MAITLLSGCGSDEIQLPSQKLEGKINGTDWSYKSGNGYIETTDFEYRVRFLSSKEAVNDPCTLPNPSLSHVRANFKPAVRSYFVTPQAVDDNQVQVTFEISPSQKLIATSGFMEVYAIESQVVIGYLQAVLDDDNKVEGSFEIRLCN
ncbi:hypothetical protein [Ekhidna sp.]|uniref:hypothetical protein n=1 Tax=Ekhidna sp. TaxID=2608089 RepID=UPI003BAC738D